MKPGAWRRHVDHRKAHARLLRLALPALPFNESEWVGVSGMSAAPGTLPTWADIVGDPMPGPLRRLSWHATVFAIWVPVILEDVGDGKSGLGQRFVR